MKIILAVSDINQKNQLYITEDGQVHTVAEMIHLVRSGSVPHVHIVVRKGIEYIRANRGGAALYGIDRITLTSKKIALTTENSEVVYTDPVLTQYLNYYQKNLMQADAEGGLYIALGNRGKLLFSTRRHVEEKLLPLKENIRVASERFSIDMSLFAGIIIDEIIRLAPLEDVTECVLLKLSSVNVSVGYAQVKLKTARDLISMGYFNPKPSDKHLDPKDIATTSYSYLYPYIADQKNNMLFGAAHVRHILDVWKREAGIDIPNHIVATLYSIGTGSPNLHPQPNERGLQIVNEFIPLARTILGI